MVREKATLTAREETIRTLLIWWIDVLEGWAEDGRGSDELGIRMMSRAYNSRTYQELIRCMKALRDEENRIYWHVAQTYRASRRMVFACPKCDKSCEPAAKHLDAHGNIRRQCKHGDQVFWVRKAVPVVNAAVDPELVLAGVRWIADRFDGEPFIPDALLGKERKAA